MCFMWTKFCSCFCDCLSLGFAFYDESIILCSSFVPAPTEASAQFHLGKCVRVWRHQLCTWSPTPFLALAVEWKLPAPWLSDLHWGHLDSGSEDAGVNNGLPATALPLKDFLMPMPSLLEFSATLWLRVQKLSFSRAPAHHIRVQRQEPWVRTHWVILNLRFLLEFLGWKQQSFSYFF